jgi:uncharacterized membrane-anchored protein YitT (DUF2179 family)
VLGALIAFDDWTIPLYSWLIIYVTGIVVDKVIAGFASSKTVIIISDHYEEIKKRILKDLNRGGTFLHGEGMYNRTEKRIIYTTISRKTTPPTYSFVMKSMPKPSFPSKMHRHTREGFTPLKAKAMEYLNSI